MINALPQLERLDVSNTKRLAAKADSFRLGLAAARARPAQWSAEDYPHDPDTSAALLLHRFLSESEPPNAFFFVSGERYRPQWRSHAWVQCGDLIIDISAHGLGARRPTLVTSDRGWHGQFSVTDKRHRAYGDYEDKVTAQRLDALYRLALAPRLPSHGSRAPAAVAA